MVDNSIATKSALVSISCYVVVSIAIMILYACIMFLLTLAHFVKLHLHTFHMF